MTTMRIPNNGYLRYNEWNPSVRTDILIMKYNEYLWLRNRRSLLREYDHDRIEWIKRNERTNLRDVFPENDEKKMNKEVPIDD